MQVKQLLTNVDQFAIVLQPRYPWILLGEVVSVLFYVAWVVKDSVGVGKEIILGE
nr:hypothetical protein [Ferrimicrobium acidiphilum]